MDMGRFFAIRTNDQRLWVKGPAIVGRLLPPVHIPAKPTY
jgi:hypothetical protein